MSITANFPTIRPTLNLDFVNSRTVDPRITFTRASTATYFDHLGVMRTAAANEPRIDFDPVTGACRGLLIEEQRTNLLLRSQEFDNAYWTRARISVVPNAAIAPDGTLTARKIVEDTSDGSHYINSQYLTSGTLPTGSVYVKAAERTYCTFQLIKDNDTGFAASSSFNINLVDGSFTGGGDANPTVTSAGNGWWRISLTATDATSTNFGVRIGLGIPSGSYTGDGSSGIFIWGAQLEAGAFPTSYIPTGASQQTRSRDIPTMTGMNFSSWYRQDEGTFVADINRPFADAGHRFSFAVFAGASNYLGFDYSRAESAGGLYWRNGGAGASSASLGASSPYRFAAAYGAGGYALSANGGALVTGTSVTPPPNVNTLNLGRQSPGVFERGLIYFKRLTYYPARLPNAQLQALTT